MIDICLATYNGERYLAQQLDSLLAQTASDVRVLARDDGSTDGTVAILHEYAGRYPGKVTLIEDDVHCGGPAPNFMEIMKHSTADYVMFSDQDDYWYPTKAEHMLRVTRRQERRAGGSDVPVLAFGDYRVVDAQLQPIEVAKGHLQIDKFYVSLNRLLVQNYVTGCTMMINRAACRLAGAWEPAILMHDWWLALCCAAMGSIVHDPTVLMDYRQHGDNDVGAKDVKSWAYRLDRLRDPAARSSSRDYLRQAQALYERLGDAMPDGSRRTLERFLEIPRLGKFARMHRLVSGGYLKSDLVRNIGFLLWI